jgi:hypothetical protein
MKTFELKPSQIITLNDYPVHSDSVLEKYFKQARDGKELPLVPVIRKNIVKQYFGGSLLDQFEAFENANPSAEYFMLDGTHRTTALNLAGRPIKAILYEKDRDITEARKLVKTGQMCKDGTIELSFGENCEELERHFREKPYFMTVRQKTEKMITEGKLPKPMKDCFKSKRTK